MRTETYVQVEGKMCRLAREDRQLGISLVERVDMVSFQQCIIDNWKSDLDSRCIWKNDTVALLCTVQDDSTKDKLIAEFTFLLQALCLTSDTNE